MTTYKLALRMPNGKDHILKIESETASNEAINAAKQEVKEWAIEQYGEAPRVILCSVENNKVEVKR